MTFDIAASVRFSKELTGSVGLHTTRGSVCCATTPREARKLKSRATRYAPNVDINRFGCPIIYPKRLFNALSRHARSSFGLGTVGGGRRADERPLPLGGQYRRMAASANEHAQLWVELCRSPFVAGRLSGRTRIDPKPNA